MQSFRGVCVSSPRQFKIKRKSLKKCDRLCNLAQCLCTVRSFPHWPRKELFSASSHRRVDTSMYTTIGSYNPMFRSILSLVVHLIIPVQRLVLHLRPRSRKIPPKLESNILNDMRRNLYTQISPHHPIPTSSHSTRHLHTLICPTSVG